MTTTFAYAPAGQIATRTLSNTAYAYAGAANASVVSSVNGLNQHPAVGGVALTHDARGNIASVGSTAYTYSQLNQLHEAPGVQLYYDMLGRLDLTYTGSEGTTFTYAGADLLGEHVYTTGALVKRYVPGPGADEPVVEYDASGARRWLLADERGSVIAATTAAGAAASINSYDDHGVPAGGNAGRFGYTGQTWIPEVGLHYYKARMYSPTLGRFMQTDPIGYEAGMNLYGYVGGDPLNYTDPSGLATTSSPLPNCNTLPSDTSLPCEVTVNGGGGGGWFFGGGIVWLGGALRTNGGGVGSDTIKTALPQKILEKVGCTLGNAADAVKFAADVPDKALSLIGDAVEAGLNEVHDAVFTPACGGPCGLSGEARAALSNKNFRRWFHQVYKQQQGFSGGGKNNPDMSPEEVMDAYDEWQQNQFKFKSRKC